MFRAITLMFPVTQSKDQRSEEEGTCLAKMLSYARQHRKVGQWVTRANLCTKAVGLMPARASPSGGRAVLAESLEEEPDMKNLHSGEHESPSK